MKKKGFTLAEILIALAIVGSIAAISIPMIHKISPDKDKAIVLKVFKTVNEINNELINNPTNYRFNDGSTNCRENNGILNCTQAPLDGHNSNATGDTKYPRLLAEYLNLSDNISVGATTSFTTSDGVDWQLQINKNGNVIERYDLTINTNNPQRDNCVYNHTTCKNPRRFTFQIDNNAIITGSDALTRAYIENPDDLSSRVEDLQRAEQLD